MHPTHADRREDPQGLHPATRIGFGCVGFRDAYLAAADDVLELFDRAAQTRLAEHNPGLHPDRHNMRTYLEASAVRYQHAIDLVQAHGGNASSFLDVGAWLGAFPLALARLGHRAVAVDAYGYAGDALDGIRKRLEEAGVTVVDCDFTSGEHDLGRFDVVTNMAMIEHLPDSPRTLLRNLHRACRGLVILETPNLGYGYHRWDLLLGRSPLPPIEELYVGDPFTGHHREYTADELRRVLDARRFRPDRAPYVQLFPARDARNLRQPGYWLARSFSSCREVLIAAARPLDL